MGTPSSTRARCAASREMAWRPSQPTVRVAGISTGPSGVLARTPVVMPSVLDKAGGLPAHAEFEAGEAGGFGGEEVEEVPLGHKGDELCVSGKVGEIGHGDALIADVAGEPRDLASGGWLRNLSRRPSS